MFPDYFSVSYDCGVRRTSRNANYSTIPSYHNNSKKRFHLKDTTKNFIKSVDISSLLNTDLSNLNDSSLML